MRRRSRKVHTGTFRGKPAVDYRDLHGKRHRITFATKRERDEEADRIRDELKGPARRCEMPYATVREFGYWWLTYLDTLVSAPEPRIKARTVESYRWALTKHVYDTLGSLMVRDIWHGDIVKLLAELGTRLARNSVRIVRATIHTFFQDAVSHGIITTNPASMLSKAKRDRLTLTDAQRDERVKVFTPDEEKRFFQANDGRYRLLFLVYARAGLRLGEGAALKLSDLDTEECGIHVLRTYGKGRLGHPKNNRTRFVPVSEKLMGELMTQAYMVRQAAMAAGSPQNEWLFPTRLWTPPSEAPIERAFKRVLKAAGLPTYFTPHSLRHSYACRMLENGCEVTDLQKYLGHANIKLTVDLYGRFRQVRRDKSVDLADDLPRR